MGHSRRHKTRARIGRVSIYLHHQSWWVYYRESLKSVRRKIGSCRQAAEQVAAQVNAQLTMGSPSFFAFEPIGVATLRQRFLEYHEHVLNSSLATVRRYRSATQHLENYARSFSRPLCAHELRADGLAAYLRQLTVAPNGHPHATPRRLRDKGVQFILETCRSLYGFAGKRRHLPPYAGNPFAELPLDRFRICDAKPIFVFTAGIEFDFLRAAADDWSFPIHFTLAKTGLRIGELAHLLIEDLDLAAGWLHVRNKPALGWLIKTGHERSVPLLPELVTVLARVIGNREAGAVFLRRRFGHDRPLLMGNRTSLEDVLEQRVRGSAAGSSRSAFVAVARTVWRDAGALTSSHIRGSFVCIARTINQPTVTCPKSWRHTFATLLQDANVDPLVRQITLGHRPSGSGLGMTGQYTHTRTETQRRQILAALRRWPKSLSLVNPIPNGVQP